MKENNTIRTILLAVGVIMLGITYITIVNNWDSIVVLFNNLLERKTTRM